MFHGIIFNSGHELLPRKKPAPLFRSLVGLPGVPDHDSKIGEDVGDTCLRNGCLGKINEHDIENCTCFKSPPCDSCTRDRRYCNTCDWNGHDEEKKLGIKR